jgi:methionine-rich copper-binding protein CopC
LNQPRHVLIRSLKRRCPPVRLSLWPLLISLLLGIPLRSQAHANLDRAKPAPDALLAAPPRTIEIWLTEPVAEESGEGDAFSIRVLDQASRDLTVSDDAVVDSDRTHIGASVRGIGTGTYTVVWQNRSATDGHTVSGSYAFRVASSTRAPGAATTDTDNPAAWAVLTRWSTFFGAARLTCEKPREP